MNSKIKIKGYKIGEQLIDVEFSHVFRATRIEDNLPVVIKIQKDEFPSKKDIEKYENDFEIGSGFHDQQIIHYYNLEPYKHGSAIVEEDFNGNSLAHQIPEGGFDQLEFLKIAIQLARGLEVIHDKNVIHKDINPSNLVYNRETGTVKFIDFGIASLLGQENILDLSPGKLEGTLAYMSPEQTGRMNRGVNYLTDFYSLGVTFYQLLCGKLPFDTKYPLELVHCHIAKPPVPPQQVNPKIVPVLSEIVMQLLEKDPEHRYKSARGLKEDLQHCLNDLDNKGEIASFELGERDYSNKFQIPQKLYGRTKEVKKLLKAFDRVINGNPELLLVSGYSGIGKSVLVQEVQKPIVGKTVFFISGKFDQLNKNVAYSGLSQAFRSLMRQILGDTEEKITEWREKLLSALGRNGQLIIDIIPELELIIGKQPVPHVIGTVEAQNRFNLLFQKFVGVFTQKETLIVLFLDDLQWADLASLKVINLLAVNIEIKHLFLIGAYRDNEVDKAHPTIITIEKIKKEGGVVEDIVLSPLDENTVNELISDTLSCSPEKSKDLTNLVYERTRGNPFFVKSFLYSLHDESLLTFESDKEWAWNIDKIKEVQVSDNVVDLILNRISQLPDSTILILQLAACIGNTFNTEILSLVSGKTSKENLSNLRIAVKSGMLIKAGAYFYFAHDRVQEAAYSLIKEQNKKALHLKIGNLLLKSIPKAERKERIFELVDHLNLSRELITSDKERLTLVELNVEAGKKAKDSAAYETALDYFLIGKELLDDGWRNEYHLTLSLHNLALESAYLSTKFDEMIPLEREVMREARSLLDKIEIYKIKIQEAIILNKPNVAVSTALEVLSMLGVTFPENPGKLNIMTGLIGTKFSLSRKKTAELIDMPEMKDPEKLAAMRIMMNMAPAVYTAAPNLLPLMFFKMIRLSLKYGNSPESSYGYAGYGFLLSSVLQDVNSAMAFGDLSLKLVDKLKAESLRPRIDFMVNSFIRNWKNPAREIALVLKEAYQTALELGDVEYAVYSCMTYSYISYFTGKELTALEQEVDAYRKATAQMKQETTLNFIEIYHQSILNLIHPTESPWVLIGTSYDERKMLPLHIEANAGTTLFYLFYNKLCLCYLFGQYQEALKNAELAEKYVEGGLGTLIIPQFHFYDSLSRLAVYSNETIAEKKKILRKVKANQKKLKIWSQFSSVNFRHKYHLVEAELAGVKGKLTFALEHYKNAVELAGQNDWLSDEGLANELCARFWAAQGNEKVAQTYMIEAHYLYNRWGAKTKVDLLEKNHAYLREHEYGIKVKDGIETIRTTVKSGSGYLDFITATKASQAISKEIKLENLLAKIMRIIIENAGAEKGVLILKSNGDLLIEASAVIDSDTAEVLQSIPIDKSEELSESIVRFVYRSGESLVLHDAWKESDYSNEPHVLKNQLKSVLCMPISVKDEILGVLYLENNLSSHVFTEERVDVLQVLVAQAAISLENSRLYDNIEKEVKEREKAEKEVRMLNEELEQRVENRTAELKEANADLEAFSYSVAHDLKSPLSSIIAFADMLSEDHVEKMDEQGQHFVALIQKDSHQMAALIEDLLAFSKMKKQELTLLAIDFHDLVKETFHQLKERESSERQIQLDLSDLPVIYGDKAMMRQVVTNLLSNALKFTRTKEKAIIQLAVEDRKDHYEFSIKDNGVGFDMKDVEKLFGVFHRLHRADEYEGTGVGLAIVHRVIQKHGGKIWAESVPNKETGFYFTIPKRK